MTILHVPFLVSLFVSVAVFATWRRRPESRHARSWALAFLLASVGWLAAATVEEQGGLAASPGMAAELAWLAAGLGFVHGLRERAGRRDRAPELGAIWAGVAFASTLLQDFAPRTELAGMSGAALCAAGLLVGAVAIGPRRGRTRAIDWSGMLLLALLAAAQLVLASSLAAERLTAAWAGWTALAAALAYVAAGLATMLLISGDLALALERLARTDPLTAIWNRRGFDEAGPFLLARLRRVDADAPAAVAIADLDGFKGVNDRYGHHTGDAVLARFAEVLGRAARRGDLLARLGGEEFALLAVGANAAGLAERLEVVRLAMAEETTTLPDLPPVTASFGVAAVAGGSLSLRDALERADGALYRAKREGRNRTIVDGVAGDAAMTGCASAFPAFP